MRFSSHIFSALRSYCAPFAPRAFASLRLREKSSLARSAPLRSFFHLCVVMIRKLKSVGDNLGEIGQPRAYLDQRKVGHKLKKTYLGFLRPVVQVGRN